MKLFVMVIKFFVPFVLFIILLGCTPDDSDQGITNIETIYFPPINSDVWETKSLASLGWNENELQPLLDYLENQNTKSFIILHKGKIVVETYMNAHDATKSWYWASAGKTLTTAICGIAQDQGLLNVNSKVSSYLGTGWTSIPLEKENLITCKNLLSMNSGLDDNLGDDVTPENLKYIADAGTRWAYHNVYVKLQDVIAKASDQTWDTYFKTNLKDKIGMTGSWLKSGDNGGLNVYWSTTRGMARFGLMIYAKGKWENTQIVPEVFLADATNTSQDINKSYGYLWWLNGKTSYHLPQTQLEFSGSLIPNAPEDMYAALGKNDQKIYIVPSKDLVIIRMGQAAEAESFALTAFDNNLWEKINNVIE